MNIVFRGVWHGYNQHNWLHTLGGEEMADIEIANEGPGIRATAGCRTQWFSNLTSAKMGAALIAVAIDAAKNTPPYHFVLIPKGDDTDARAVTLTGVTTLTINRDHIEYTAVDGKEYIREARAWRVILRKNPDHDALQNEITASRELLHSAIRALQIRARSAGSIQKAAEAFYKEATAVHQLDGHGNYGLDVNAIDDHHNR